MNPLRKLLVLGVNELIERREITLTYDPKVHEDREPHRHIFADLAGKRSVILWHGEGWGEMQIGVWWDYDHAQHPQAEMVPPYREMFNTMSPLAKRQHLPRFVGAFAVAWLERKQGKYLQGKGSVGMPNKYLGRSAKELLSALPDPTPLGYAAERKFHL